MLSVFLPQLLLIVPQEGDSPIEGRLIVPSQLINQTPLELMAVEDVFGVCLSATCANIACCGLFGCGGVAIGRGRIFGRYKRHLLYPFAEL